jgi:hypothetical protein
MLESGYVRIFRSFLNWEWYDDANTMRVFLHLILTANWEPKKWHGITIERGQRVYSRSKLAAELKMSERSVRTALNHLISTGEVTNQTTPQYSIITIKNYELYQQSTSETTNDRPTDPNMPETPMDTEMNGDIFQNQHNKNSENSTNETTSKTTNDSPHESLENSETGEAKRPAKRPTTDQPPTNDRPQFKKDKKDKKDKKNIYSKIFSEYAAGDLELLKALNDFAEMRKAIKKPLSTERAATMLIHSLDKYADDNKTKIAILNQSIFNNWQGVFPLKDQGKQNSAKPEKQYSFDIDEYERTSFYDNMKR